MQRQIVAAALALAVAGCTGKYRRQTTDEAVEATPERIERGGYVVNSLAACAACHNYREGGDFYGASSEDYYLAGGMVIDEDGLRVFIPNITQDKEAGLGAWTDDEMMRAIRDGVSRDGRLMVPLHPFDGYQHMSEEDLRSVVAYLRTVPARPQPVPTQKQHFAFPAGLAVKMGATHHRPAVGVVEPDRTDPVRYGEYLVTMGHCYGCHSMGKMGPRKAGDRWMGGGDVPHTMKGVGKVWASNLTPDEETGIGRYSDQEVKMSMRIGVRLDGKPMAMPMMMLVPHMAAVAEEDLDAIMAYLRSLPPVKHKIKDRVLEPQMAERLGGS